MRVDVARKVHTTHHDHRAHKGDVGEEVAWLGEAGRLKLKLTGIRPQEVWVHEKAKLGACDEERRDKAPDFGQGAPCEDMIGDPRDIVRADQFHMHWYRESNGNGGYGPADQYQKCVPGGVGLLEVAYRATGGAAQNISMADMIAIRERTQFDILCGYAQMKAAREWERRDWMCRCEE